MSETAISKITKSNAPTEYAKLYFAKKPEEDKVDLDSIFKEAFPTSKYLAEWHFDENTNKFLDTPKSLGEKISAAGEGMIFSFVGLMGVLLVVGGTILNKLPEHTYEKAMKPTTGVFYALCLMFGYLAYNSCNKYNKNLGTLRTAYSEADKKDKIKADKVIKQIQENSKNTRGMHFIQNWEDNERLEHLIATLKKSNELKISGEKAH